MRSRVDGGGQCRRPRWSNTLLMALRRRDVDVRQCRCNERHKPRRRAPCYIFHGTDTRFAKSSAARMLLFLGSLGVSTAQTVDGSRNLKTKRPEASSWEGRRRRAVVIGPSRARLDEEAQRSRALMELERLLIGAKADSGSGS